MERGAWEGACDEVGEHYVGPSVVHIEVWTLCCVGSRELMNT